MVWKKVSGWDPAPTTIDVSFHWQKPFSQWAAAEGSQFSGKMGFASN